MRKIFILALAAFMFAACTTKQPNTKDMNQLSFTTEQAA
jgi:uncharacterized protein YcfL